MEEINKKPINFKNSLDLVSNDRLKALERNNEYIKENLMEVENIINESNDKEYIDPKTGYKIANADAGKIWVSKNVAFIFATGAIFDKNDKLFVDSVIDFFNSDNNSYLPCEFKTYAYTSDVIKKFENLEAIGNGNYHICCFVLCYADKEFLKLSPEPMFKRRGICEHLIDETEIRDEISRLMSLYGFTKVQYAQPSSVSRIGKRDNKTQVDVKLQYESEIDYASPNNRELLSSLKTKDELMGTRSRIIRKADGKRSFPKIKDKRHTIKNDITNRIDGDKYISYTMPTDILGGNVRINNNLEMRLNSAEINKQPEYQIYNKEPEPDDRFKDMNNRCNGLIKAEFVDKNTDIQMPTNYTRKEEILKLHKNNGDMEYISYGRR